MGKSDISELIELVYQVITEEKEIKEEFSWKERTIVAHGAPIRKNREKISGIIILVRDVTELRKLDEMRKLFVANVSHELKTPLTAIRGYLEAILDGVIEDAELKKKYLKRVLSETDRMTRLVKDVLDLSRLQADQFDFKFKEVDLKSLIYSIINDFTTKIENREIKIDIPENVILIADKDKLEQVIINLVSNAIKFTAKDGFINITVEKINNQIRVEIIDNGVGIPKSELSYIWERFHQVDRARRPDKEGTGLGLAIAKEIIEGLGGEIKVESKEGEGSKFSFVLPNLVDLK